MEHSNDWDLQALVRSCGTLAADNEAEPPAPAPVPMPVRRGGVSYGTVGRAAAAAPEFVGRPVSAASFYDLEYLDLYDDLPRAPFLITPASASSRENEVFISFPAASTSGQSSVQPRKQPGRKPGVRTPRPKRSKKSQVKKVVCEVPVADGGVSTDLWAWRKYGQKPIKGSPYPRGYYKCSSLKACKARKMVERSPANPEVLVVTYIAEHCHAVPTQINTLAGTTRNKPDSPDDGHSTSHGAAPDKREDSADTCSTAVDELTADDENNELWLPVDMELDDLFFSSFDDDFDYFLDDGALLGRRLSL